MNIIPDIIVSWPRNNDYPLWRKFIKDNRTKFNEVIVVFTETFQGDDYREFVRKAMFKEYVHFVDSPLPNAGEDWRDIAVNQALLHSYNADWIWFTEQDFLITDDKFWDFVYQEAGNGREVIGTMDGQRLHPCCIFIKREALNKTRKNFGIIPGELDHFGLLQKDIDKLNLDKFLLTDGGQFGYKHYNGLSQNWTLASRGEKPNYKIEEFIDYLEKCLKAEPEITLDERFKNVANSVITAYKR